MLAFVDQRRAGPGLILMAAAAVLYLASRAAVAAMARADGSDPGRRALGQWLPIAAAAIAAALMKQADVAVSIVFGTSVALLSLVVGMVLYLAPMQSLPVSRRVWPFVLPSALLTLIAGFSGRLTWWHAIMFLALGGAILPVWLDSPDEPNAQGDSPPARNWAGVLIGGALMASIIGGVLAVMGTVASTQYPRVLTAVAMAAAILSPLLALPTLGTATALAQRGHAGRALSAIVGTVILNLCVLLPMVIFLSYAGLWFNVTNTGGAHLAFDAGHIAGRAAPYPMIAWRIETVLLVVLGFALVPVSMGKWMLGRMESSLLVLGYAAYLLAVIAYGLNIA